MTAADADLLRGLQTLRWAVAWALAPQAVPAGGPGHTTCHTTGHTTGHPTGHWLLSEAVDFQPAPGPGPAPSSRGEVERPCSSETDAAEAERLIGLVELARGGDTEAFGQLYDHYHLSVYRFIYY